MGGICSRIERKSRIILDFPLCLSHCSLMSRKQKGKRGKTISVQLLKDEDSAFRELADRMNQSAANAARLILVAEIKREREAAKPEPMAVSA